MSVCLSVCLSYSGSNFSVPGPAPFAALSVSLPQEAFNRNGHAACLVGHTDRRQVTLLGLLDLTTTFCCSDLRSVFYLSAAFNCVDHNILLQRLQIGLGLSDVVLGWIQSFLTNRTQQVTFSGQLSGKQLLLFAVLQGSVLGPLLHLLYTVELEQLILRHGLHIHQYADDKSVPVSDAQITVHRFAVCVHDVNEWMRASRLRLNPTKTQVMWLGSGQQLKQVDISDIPVLSTSVPVVESACDLGVIIDSQLTLSLHVAALCRAE